VTAPSQIPYLAMSAKAARPAVAPVGVPPRPRRFRRRRANPSADLAIRLAGARDTATLRDLERLDGRPLAAGARLVAELGGIPVAAIAVADGSVVADPFERTGAVVDLLRVRARQLRVADPARPA
jgi:hypothetical protein